MKILWVATKAPWPPCDGGRLLLWNTLGALHAAGHRITLVAPFAGPRKERLAAAAALGAVCDPQLVPARPRHLVPALLHAWGRGLPLTIVRHQQPTVASRVQSLLAAEPFDLVQAEQVQAVGQCGGPRSGPPRVLRAQNVESDLWAASAVGAGPRALLLRREARCLARFEGVTVRTWAVTVALTPEDRDRLTALASGEDNIEVNVEVVPAPFEASLPAGDPLPGNPAVVLFGSGGWRPNRDGALRFLRDAWPALRQALPEARLHVFGLASERVAAGDAGAGIVAHPAPAESQLAYPRGAILVVPLWVASGVRIKILEAWARGLPVVATPAAARGLGAEDGEALLLAEDAASFARAVARIAADPALAAGLVAGGQQRLRTVHDPAAVASRLQGIYTSIGSGAWSLPSLAKVR